METVVSGIRSTGNLHLGNYFGAIKNFLRMQHDANCFFFIADYHSLTTHPTPEGLHDNVRSVMAEYLACGIDPEVATLYVQSDVPEVAELYLLLNMNAYLGELERTTSFKDKARKNPNNVNAGLLTYPVLMAADIIMHHAQKVPVGKDQEQNLEMARKFAKRFNHMYGVEYFTEPSPYNFNQELVKIPGLDGSGKMGKSEGNALGITEDEKSLRKKVMKAVTDAGPTEMNQTPPEVIENLFTLMDAVSPEGKSDFYREKYAKCEIRYGDMKKDLAQDIIDFTNPIRTKYNEIIKDTEYLRKVVSMGKDKAQASAAKTVKEVREIIGFKAF